MLTEVNSVDEFTDAVQQGGKVAVLFTQPSNCIPCQRFEPAFLRAVDDAPEIRFARVDLDTNWWAVQDYGIMSVPTVHLYEDGQYKRALKVPAPTLAFLNDIRG